MAVPHLLPYTASKFALTGYSEGLHAELRAKGVRVTTVCPGLMRTGSQVRAKFVGDVEKEKAWFDLGATHPRHRRLHPARRQAHPQRPAHRLGRDHHHPRRPGSPPASPASPPGFTALAGSVANQLILPAPTGNKTITSHG